MNLKKLIPFIVVVVILFVVSNMFVGCTRIEAGYVGIKVNLYGSERGVQDVAEVSGLVWYNPLMTRIYEFPTFLQHKVWTSDLNEDSPRNEEFTVTSKDGLNASFDVGIDYKVIAEKVPEIFKEYRKDLDQITNEFIRTKVRNAYNSTASKFDAAELVAKRSDYEAEVRQILEKELEIAGFEISQIAIVGKIRLPPAIEEAINTKIKATQDAIRTENEKQRVVAEASKRIEEARGFAEAMRIRTEAEAVANELLSKSLTGPLIQKMYIDKWDGKLPVYGEAPKLFKNVD